MSRLLTYSCFEHSNAVDWLVAELLRVREMEIARPEFKCQKRRRQAVLIVIVLVVVVAVGVGMARLRPAAPSVERGTVWTGTVKPGSWLRQVHGLGLLIPSQQSVRQIPAAIEATLVRIRMLPGSQAKADSIPLEMSQPQVDEGALDAQLQLKAAEAEYQRQRVKLESDLMSQQAGAPTVSANYGHTKRQADTDKALYQGGTGIGELDSSY